MFSKERYVTPKTLIYTIRNYSSTQAQILNKNMYSDCKLFINKYPAGIVCIILV